MNSSESAEAVVKMALQGSEVALKISGEGTKEILIMLYAILNGSQKIKGKTKLTNMLKSGKELKIFSLKQEDLKKFTEEAKRYGILFSVLVDKKNINPDGLVDIMVKTEDSYKINHIVERFELASVDRVKLKSEIEKELVDKLANDVKNKGEKVSVLNDEFIEKISKNVPSQKELNEMLNPSTAKMEKSPLSEPSSKNKENLEVTKKSSVREKLENIKREQQEKEISKNEVQHEKSKRTKTTMHKNTKVKVSKVKSR